MDVTSTLLNLKSDDSIGSITNYYPIKYRDPRIFLIPLDHDIMTLKRD